MKSGGFCGFDAALLGFVLTLRCGKVPRGDLTNYLGGVADVLESKDKRLRSKNKLDHLGDLLGVSLYRDDRQVRDARVVLELAHPAPRVRDPALATELHRRP